MPKLQYKEKYLFAQHRGNCANCSLSRRTNMPIVVCFCRHDNNKTQKLSFYCLCKRKKTENYRIFAAKRRREIVFAFVISLKVVCANIRIFLLKIGVINIDFAFLQCASSPILKTDGIAPKTVL